MLVTFIAIGLLQSIYVQARMTHAARAGHFDELQAQIAAPTCGSRTSAAASIRSLRAARPEHATRRPSGQRLQGPSKGLKTIEEASTGQRRPRRDPRRAAGGNGNRRRHASRARRSGRRRRKTTTPGRRIPGRRALPGAPRSALDRRQHLQGPRRQRARRAGGRVRRHRPGEERVPARRRDRAAGSRGAPARAAARAARAGRSPTCSSPARRSSSRSSRIR